MAIGWISIHRELQNCWVADDKPYNFMAAWVDLLLMASHKDTKLLFDGKLIDVKRGNFITSILKLSSRWGWSRTKTKRFLDLLVSDNMIEYKTDNKKTSISIVNYAKFQDLTEEKEQQKSNKKATEVQQKDIRKTSEEHQKDTINNNKQCNNNDKQYIYSEIPELERAFLDFEQMRKKIKKPISTENTKKRLMAKLDALSGGNVEMKIAILNQSTDNNYQGLFELKDKFYLNQNTKHAVTEVKEAVNPDIARFLKLPEHIRTKFATEGIIDMETGVLDLDYASDKDEALLRQYGVL